MFSDVCFFQVSHNIFILDNLHVEVAFQPTDQKFSHMWLVVYLLYNNTEIFFEPQGIQVQSNGKYLYFKCFSEERAIKLREFSWMQNYHSPLNAHVNQCLYPIIFGLLVKSAWYLVLVVYLYQWRGCNDRNAFWCQVFVILLWVVGWIVGFWHSGGTQSVTYKPTRRFGSYTRLRLAQMRLLKHKNWLKHHST